jgi:murein DD-endopeptidase MepM/ murein hydrolase activator NlpD
MIVGVEVRIMLNLIDAAGSSGRGVRGGSVMGAIIAALALAGCSADVMRLDSPARFGFNDTPNTVSKPSVGMSRAGTMGAAPPADTMAQPYAAPRPNRSQDMNVAALPDATGAPEPAPSYSPAYTPPRASAPTNSLPPVSGAPAKSARPMQPPAAASAPVGEKGEAFQVGKGDTLFGLSKKYHVAVSELMSVNGLTSPALKPGQTLYLPVGKNTAKKPLARPTEAQVAAAPAAAAPSAEVLAKYDGSYTVKKGESLSTIASQMKVPVAELQSVNGIVDVRKVKPGAVLKVPSAGAGSTVAAAPARIAAPVLAPVVAKVPAQVVAKETAAAIPSSTQPVLLNGAEKKVATASPTNDAGSPETATAPAVAPTVPAAPTQKVAQAATGAVAAAGGDAGAKLRWPVKGKVIANFGPRTDGTHNDGVNLSVPLGTEIHAAESGVVAYAGSELKGYGNLILVRHDNGWITAYAHTEEMLAKRGDKVKRGQVIAKAGKSGQVDQPQVHFELRQGSKPVDPTPFMDKL